MTQIDHPSANSPHHPTPQIVAQPSVLSTIPRTWKQSEFPSTDEQVMKLWHTYTMEIYSDVKKSDSIKFSGGTRP